MQPTQARISFVWVNISSAVQRPVHEIKHPLYCTTDVKDKWNCTSTTPVCLPEDGASMFPRKTGTQLPEYAAPQRKISILKCLNYILVEIA